MQGCQNLFCDANSVFDFLQERRCNPAGRETELSLSCEQQRAETITLLCSELHSTFAVWSALPHVHSCSKMNRLVRRITEKCKRSFPSANGAIGGLFGRLSIG